MSQPRFRYSMTVCVLALALVVPESAFSDAIRAAGRDAVPQTPIVNDDFYSTSSSQPIRHVHRTSRVHGRAAHAGKLLRDDGRQSDVDFLGSADPRRGACRIRRQRQRGVHWSFATTSRSLSGVVPMGTYQLNIYACNQCGNGPVTDSLTVSIP